MVYSLQLLMACRRMSMSMLSLQWVRQRERRLVAGLALVVT